jgi:Uma2 family endonuclease
VQLPLTIPDYDEPEPDVAVCRFREDEYARSHPTPADALIVIEVSDSTLDDDLRVKLPVYARAAIPEAWIADLTRRGDAVSRYSDPDPSSGQYRTVARFRRGEEIRSAVLPGLALPVDAVLGPRV